MLYLQLKTNLNLNQQLDYADLVSFGFTATQIATLAEEHVFDIADLAELSTFDLTDILPELDTEIAKAMIIQARKVGELHGENS